MDKVTQLQFTFPKITPANVESYLQEHATGEVKHNTGLHGNVVLFEMGEHQFEFECVRRTGDDELVFVYTSYDSDEGEVQIRYYPISGDLEAELNNENGSFDVAIRTCSDVWGLASTASAVSEVITLHRLLGHDMLDRERAK